MNLKEELEGYLPSKLSKALLAIALLLSGTPFLLPESVISEIQWTPKAQLLHLKVTVSLMMLLIGSFAILLVEIISRKREKTAAENARVFDQTNGIWRDTRSNLCYCPKCKTSPLREIEKGWYCSPCNLIHESAAYLEKIKQQRKEQDARIASHNRGGSWMSR